MVNFKMNHLHIPSVSKITSKCNMLIWKFLLCDIKLFKLFKLCKMLSLSFNGNIMHLIN